MGYIKKEFRNILNVMDAKEDNLPSKWDKFVESKKVYHNLIISRKKGKICTNCKHEFKSNKKVGEYEKCPNCRNKYLIKSAQLKKYFFINNLILLDKVNNNFVFRYFELYSKYNKNLKSFDSSVVEFARSLFDRKMEVVNDRVSKCQCYIHINHLKYPGAWREYTRNYGFGKTGYIYPYNLNDILKDTKYKYLKLKDFAINLDEINFEYILKYVASYPSFEMLGKMKLYKLALNADEFDTTGSFYKIFGVSKDYYKFMRRNNINYKELKYLRLLNKKNIKLIRYLTKFNVDTLKEILEYISIDNFIKYAKMHKGKLEIYMYKDYLRFAKLLGLDLKNKKYIFPDNLKVRHDELEKSFELHNKEILNKSIASRLKKLKQYIYKDDKFIIIPARTVEDLEQESKEQCNCVRTYSERYARGDCDIYFMRLINKINNSLVTIEVKNNKVVQSRVKYNEIPKEIHLSFLKKWEKNVLNKVRV